VLVMGSGSSFHNVRAFSAENTRGTQNMNHDFEEWLLNTCHNSDDAEEERVQKLMHWEKAYGACYCHPREEHLLPLHVCYGVAQSPCCKSFEIEIMHKKVSMYLW
jgi:4,5-DOPA dioxygenase extradiol